MPWSGSSEARTSTLSRADGLRQAVAPGIPIGTGVTEAACEVLVKQRLCGSGMGWRDRGAGTALSLRALTYTAGRWDQFRMKLSGEGFPVAT